MPPNLKYPKGFSDLTAALQAAAKEEANISAQGFPPLAGTADEGVASNDIGDEEYFQEDLESYKPSTVRENHESPNNNQEQAEDQEKARRKQTRKFVKRLSSLVTAPEELNTDEERLLLAAEDVGKCGYGLQAISVWIFDDESDRLCPAKGGWWHKPSLDQSDALARLVDSSREDYLPAVSVSPGVDLPGLLWLESNKFETRASVMNRVASINQLVGAASTGSLPGLKKEEALIWRDLKSLVEDPDTAKGPRMSLLHEAGMEQATGISFQTQLQSGLVVFFARKDVDPEIINGQANVAYLQQAANFIGGAAAMAETRRALIGQQIEKGIFARRSDASDIEAPAPEKEKPCRELGTHKEEDENNRCSFLPHRMRVWLKKSKGGGMQIPPSLSVRQSLWTAFGAFCGLLVLSSLNEYYQYLSDGDYALLIGPFGALMTLQYGLTAAPASQPRNAIMGQAVSGAVSLAFTYIPEYLLPVWIRRAVGPAIAIATMVKLGFTHPPAGAHAVLYASGKYNFAFYALVVLSTAISVIPATLVNNMSIKRQYPTYWGLTLPDWIRDLAASFRRRPDVRSREEASKQIIA